MHKLKTSDIKTQRIICWFSCGAASAVAAKLVCNRFPQAQIVRCIVNNEHEDNSRFADDVAEWIGRPIIEIRSKKYKDCWQVWEERRYLNGPGGALCTVEMKKKPRLDFQRPDDLQVFGFTVEERERAARFTDNNPEVLGKFPLIHLNVSKDDCYKRITAAGLKLPLMYRLGYNNANCIGCVKGGMGYWNKIRVDFPEVFDRMSKLEVDIGASCIKGQPLRTLSPDRGRHEDLILPDCGLFCGEY